MHFLKFPSEKSINCGLVFLALNHFLTCKFDRRDCRQEQFIQCMWFDLSLFTDDLFPENSTPRYARCCWQWASKNSQPKCWTRIYPSYLWHFVTPHFTQIFGQELKRSLHKYFGEKQRKIHFQYHIVGPERRYWNWISIHFLPSINHIWPPGANISEKLKYHHDPVCVIGEKISLFKDVKIGEQQFWAVKR